MFVGSRIDRIQDRPASRRVKRKRKIYEGARVVSGHKGERNCAPIPAITQTVKGEGGRCMGIGAQRIYSA